MSVQEPEEVNFNFPKIGLVKIEENEEQEEEEEK